uniref:Uncharacterized protein n=1 Tax=Romanomermis culicivorax TaxID=13658 RepID=A0A915HHT5_ROMCU
DSKDRKRRHAQSDDELIAIQNHKRIKVEHHLRRNRHQDQQAHPLLPSPASSTVNKHRRKKNFNRKRRYLKSKMQRRFALENLSVCTYAEWLKTKGDYKKAQKMAFTELKCQLKNRPLEKDSKFKRGKDKLLQKADVSNAS